jgi:hypothetical protein
MEFKFYSASGEICCLSDNPNHLCKACKEKLAASQSSSPLESHAASGAVHQVSNVSLRPAGVPPPPDLVASIRQKRGMKVTVATREAEIRKYFATHQPMADGGRP